MVEVKRSSDLEELSAEARRRVRAGDDRWFEERTAHGDVLMLGTAPGEEWRGRDAVLALTIEQGKAMNETVGIADEEEPERRVEAYEAGNTGWIVTHSSFLLSDGSRVPIRSVSILIRDDDTWRSVFSETAIVVANELLAPGSPLAQANV
jgi:hypothetical protein